MSWIFIGQESVSHWELEKVVSIKLYGIGHALSKTESDPTPKFLQDVNNVTVIVVSPLVALMQYQIEGLQKKGVTAIYLQDLCKANMTIDS